jgi:hypothetical protein
MVWELKKVPGIIDYHSPISFIRTLLDIGADPNPIDHAGFPPLIAALSCSRPQPGSAGRPVSVYRAAWYPA